VRTHAHTKLYDFEGAVSRWRDGVPLELALDHPYEGLVVLCCEPGDGGSHDALAEASADHVAILLQAPGMDLVSNWRFHVEERDFEAPMALGSEGGTTERMVQLGFVQGRPEAVWPAVHRYAADLEASGAGRVTFAAPFIPTIVGTDTYTDELW